MSIIDWLVLSITLFSIIIYGVWKSRDTKNIKGYLLADKKLPWYHVGLSVMATQASAITFLSAPGQAYSDGLRFIQFYFGLPLAMVLLCITFIPIFQKLNVFTAYEYLEQRFDSKTRSFIAFLFLLQRGLSTGITIYAPAIILSTILGVEITYTTFFMGGMVVLYTVYGGTKAVSYTQMFQMCVIFFGLFLAAYMVVKLLPENIGFFDALHIAGKMDKLNAIDTHFDLKNRYNIWSGLIGGFFLQLSYFGTDQSQVGRYLTGKSITESRLGLIMNGIVKIPMQFFILLIGTLVFVFYQFNTPPVFFNDLEVNRIENSIYKTDYQQLEKKYKDTYVKKQEQIKVLKQALDNGNDLEINESRTQLKNIDKKSVEIRKKVLNLMEKNGREINIKADTNDTNYVFLSFVMKYLPEGLVGLLIAIIFLAAMGSTASGLNSLASTTMIDFYKRFNKKQASETSELASSRWITVFWGIFCMIVALYASKLGNLIEAVNILGSLFYGTILGVFLVAFYLKNVKGAAVFCAALLTEAIVIMVWRWDIMAFLWLNVLGCVLLMGFALLLQIILTKFQKHQK
jgi:solute:Na+ symporter, SSS family